MHASLHHFGHTHDRALEFALKGALIVDVLDEFRRAKVGFIE